MKVQFELVVGENKFTLIEDVDNNADFFKKLHFYSTLPKVGPNGETDLVLTYRVAQKKYDYYSIVSQKAKMEFKFGQSLENKGSLFAKGWEPLYEGNDETDVATPSVGTSVGLGGSVVNATSPAPQVTTGLGSVAKVNPTPAPAPAASAPMPAAAPTAQVQAQAANILAKFGI